MTAKPTGGASAYACISSLMNAAIGAGVLSVPCAFSYLGIVLGPTIMLIVVCMEVSSLCILVRTAEQFTVSSYQELVLVRFGSRSGLPPLLPNRHSRHFRRVAQQMEACSGHPPTSNVPVC
ncbi:hypothetical protein CYMTET_44447 [Cymbomonas tetramitiformis]|uniref:Amino acid transporter transmembrane domain-containing protein n=1 Tax=Cymbomonas tetramitiformis TaxID=36881 RepID=A0AAE0C1V6_9CHLO|nr:hypothetical protein CYMTET_44447 [Cymbomonas tetramitiformis]